MKQQEIITLKMIESLERDPKQTQRDLAKELNISLGLVNAFTKRLVQKGIFKITSIPKNRIKYILTPHGMYEKTILAYHYLLHSLEFYKETRVKIKAIYDRLFLQGEKEIIIVGAGELAEIALIALQDSHLKLAGIVDDEKAGQKLLGVTIKGCAMLKTISSDPIVLVTRTNNYDRWMIRPHRAPCKIIDLNTEMGR